MKKIVVFLLLLASPAMAQQPMREYTLKLPADVINQIGIGLDELPGHIRKPIVDSITKQITEQNDAAAKAEAAKKTEPVKPND